RVRLAGSAAAAHSTDREALRGAEIPERDARLFAHIARILFPQPVLGFYLGA
ncbi:hypothetical protein ATANTOWER_000315, partial [Ataeniobius toweri]|nr:hypothetical protein [Ataeniobius toweri]